MKVHSLKNLTSNHFLIDFKSLHGHFRKVSFFIFMHFVMLYVTILLLISRNTLDYMYKTYTCMYSYSECEIQLHLRITCYLSNY